MHHEYCVIIWSIFIVQNCTAIRVLNQALFNFGVGIVKKQLIHNMSVVEMRMLRGRCGCKQGSLLMKYLGLPLGAKSKDKSIWNPILEKMERRLEGWKRLYLSKGGRVTLIKSTISNLPTYFLSLFAIYLLVWLTALRGSGGISYGAAQEMILKFIWLNGLQCVRPFHQVDQGLGS